MNRLKHHNICILCFLFFPTNGLVHFYLEKTKPVTKKMARRSWKLWICSCIFFWIGRCHIEFQRHKIFICIYIHFLEFSSTQNLMQSHTNTHSFSLSAWAAVIINLCHYTHIHVFALLHLIKAMSTRTDSGRDIEMYWHFQCKICYRFV